MIPNPPAWISARMTPCPNPDQWTGVSTTISPVRHMAEVAVNRDSMTEVCAPDLVAAGMSSRTEPMMIAAAKLNATTRTGVRVACAASRRRSAVRVDGAVRSVTPTNTRPVDAADTAGLPGGAGTGASGRR